jgi:diguanylate cyclase (GGDEF)-like protein/putative nucleotidyltransferase with HDIG domain
VVSGLTPGVSPRLVAWTTAASALLLAPGVLYPGALAATIAASVLASRGNCLLSTVFMATAAIAWSKGHLLARARARTAAEQQRLSGLHLATIEALASAIDAKDKTSATHVHHVESLARALAREVGVPEAEVQAVATAALLHDVGKLAVPEHILSKPGPLTEEEFEKIKIHPQVGFEIIEHVPFPSPVAPLVLCHHERWDGTGYPLGLRGDDIPLGARILAVSDYFDSVMRDRPYNKGISTELAMLSLQQQSGKALDPHLVSVFLDLLPRLRDEASVTGSADTGEDRDSERLRLSPELDGKTAFDDIAKAHQEIYALYEIAQAIGSSLGTADTMSLIADKLTPLVPFSSCALFVNEDDGTVRCRFAAGVNEDDLREIVLAEGRGLAGWVIRNRRTLVNAMPSADFEAAQLRGVTTDLRSALVCPLISGERVVGAIALYHVAERFYSEEHRRLLDRISEQTAAAIANSIVFEQTREDALRDSLTGLPNTRYMFTHLTRELARAQRQGIEVSVLVLDLDDFKRINDTYGHQAGDRALQHVARVLRETVRQYDVCARYAGDEFIIGLTGCGAEEAEAKRVELQNAVAALSVEVAPGRTVRVSMSAGGAVFPTDGETYEILLATADGRMYRDKNTRKPTDAGRAAALPDVPAVAREFTGPSPTDIPVTSGTPVN